MVMGQPERLTWCWCGAGRAQVDHGGQGAAGRGPGGGDGAPAAAGQRPRRRGGAVCAAVCAARSSHPAWRRPRGQARVHWGAHRVLW